MTFRVKIITPIQVDEADLQRRRDRYGARASGHEPLFREIVARYGYGDRLIAVRALGLPYAQARQPERFDAAMREQLRAAVEQDGVGAVVMGSTTMALTPELAAVAGAVPLFLTGMATLGVMESLWRDGALSRRLHVSSD